ncbi:MAG: CPBP family intramembrane metalloprotease [Chlorobiaceae bacterium]|nr:CPBP family intramembrane metalloprotease [Chlorobiaceae bacterium]
MNMIVEVVMVSGFVSVAAAALLWLGRYAPTVPFRVSRLGFINSQSKYQLLLLVLSLAVLVALFLLNAAQFRAYMRPGDLAAPAHGVSWLGIAEGESWLELGASMSVSVTLVTTLFVALRFRREAVCLKQVMLFFPWIVLFSLTNSFSEEVVFRLGFIVPLAGKVNPALIVMLSAVFFGIPHYRGMPNGVAGTLMAGFLGWLLARSVLETQGIFWAWFIHFLQDVVIYTAFVMSAIRGSIGNLSSAESSIVR